MNRRGITLIELLVGVAAATIIGMVTAQILKAGIMTYNYSVRQNEALTRARKALGGEGSSKGILNEVRSAHGVSALDAASLAVVSGTSSVVTSYYVSGRNLYRSKSAVVSLQADSVTGLAVGYYNLDGNGRIAVTTVAASAQLVTVLATLQGKTSGQKDFKLYSGARLRNHP